MKSLVQIIKTACGHQKEHFHLFPCGLQNQVSFQSCRILICQGIFPSLFISTSNKIIPTEWNTYLVYTYVVIKDSSDYGIIKLIGGNGKCHVQIKYMHSIHNMGAIDYPLKIVSGYAKQFILLFSIKYYVAKSNATIDAIL